MLDDFDVDIAVLLIACFVILIGVLSMWGED
jgi:hypothetical protein